MCTPVDSAGQPLRANKTGEQEAMRNILGRRWRMLAPLFVALLAALALSPAAPAHSAVTLVDCTAGTEMSTFNPPLTFVTQPTTVHVDGTLGPCVSTTNPNINSATITINGSGTADCLLASFNSTYVAHWNNGPNSVIRYTTTINIKPDGETVFVALGQVVSGQFEGAEVVRTTVEATVDVLACLTTGVRTISGPTTLTLIG
jgi:hypothetical protein